MPHLMLASSRYVILDIPRDSQIYIFGTNPPNVSPKNHASEMIFVSLSIINTYTVGSLDLREKLIEQFNLFIQDDSKLIALDGIFDSINTSTEASSIIPEEHYKVVEERRRKCHAGETIGSTWSEVKQKLKDKYGF